LLFVNEVRLAGLDRGKRLSQPRQKRIGVFDSVFP
jgi:hypothetical protein